MSKEQKIGGFELFAGGEPTVGGGLSTGSNGTDDPALFASRRRSIVIIEDNRDTAKALQVLVSVMGGEAHVAHAGLSGLSVIREVRPGLVFVDIGLPDIDGYEVCRIIRREPFGTAMTVIAISGWGAQEDKRRATEAGFDAHLTKPPDVAKLQRYIAGLLLATSE